MSATRELNAVIESMTYVVEIPCPECGGEMRAYKEKNADGTERCAPICFYPIVDEFGRKAWGGCGYRSFNKKDNQTTNELYELSLKAKAMNVYLNASYFPTSEAKEYKMDNYSTGHQNVSHEQIEAKNRMIKKINEMLQGEIRHIMLIGQTGVGKTHLGIASVREIIEQSNYDKKGLVIKWSSLLSDVKKSFTNSQLASDLNNKMKDYKTCDVLLIDDLGTELGRMDDNNTSKMYSLELLEELLNAREDKNLIITTNLDSKVIKEAYGDRVLSRMMKHLTKDEVITFRETKDMRRTPMGNMP